MSLNEEEFKALLNNELPITDENQSLEKVLSKGKHINEVKDVAGLFIGWIWVIFLGFGASMYSAKRRYQQHHQNKSLTKRTIIISKQEK